MLELEIVLASCKTLAIRLSPCVLDQPDGWARGEREGYGGPYDVTSLSLSIISYAAVQWSRPASLAVPAGRSIARVVAREG